MSKKSRQPEALSIVANNPNLTASMFAEWFWPDDNMHTKLSNQGNAGGSVVGKAAWFAGSCYLAKLVKKGLVKEAPRADMRLRLRYNITASGSAAVELGA